jgi:hypothetical protein
LLRNHPSEWELVTRLEREITHTLRQDPNAVVDHVILAQTLHLRPDAAGRYLAELVKYDVLKPRWFWICPNEHGTTMEADSEAEFPDVIECHVCGQEHEFDIDDVNVEFLPTDRLMDVIRNAAR